MSYQSSRTVAVSLLTRILDHRQTLDEALSQEAGYAALQGSDKGFARAITSAVLRRLGHIDQLLGAKQTGRAFEDLDVEVRHLLRIGAAQICLLKTPSHAAVSETVEAARYFEGSRRAGGLVNAVLRKLSATDLEGDDLPPHTVWPLSFQTLVLQALGEAGANALAQAHYEPPPLDLTCTRDRKLWAERLNGTPLGGQSVRLSEGQVESLTGYESGSWWVQDVAATLPVMLLAPSKGARILDMCAAPGGKTLQIAAEGANVTALDRSAKRLRRVQQNLKRTRLEAVCVAADATKWESPDPFDGVLLDAPCSALGTLRRHPEGPWIKSEDDLARFPQIQARLLEAAAKHVKPGGRLVYCVCTPLPREGVDVIEAFLQDHENWVREPAKAGELPEFEAAMTEEGDVLTLPDQFEAGCDAFYISRLRRAE